MCEQSESYVIKELKKQIKTLSEDLSFERNLNNILENIRNNSLILIENCKCLTNQTTIKVIKHLNTIYTDLKTMQNISKLNQIQNEIQIKPIEPKLQNQDKTNPSKSQKTGRILRTLGKKRSIDKSLKTIGNKNKRIKTIEIKDNLQSEYSLVTEMLGIENKSVENVDNSDTEEFSAYENSDQLKAIEYKTNVISFLDPLSHSSAGPSFANQLSNITEDLTNHSTEPSLEDDEILQEFNCNTCDQTFDQKIKLQNHLSKKHRIKSFECELCPYKTFSVYHLKRHKTSHTSEKPFQCTIDGCNKWFKTKEHLYEHKNLKHSSYTPFECDICNYKTSRKASFNYHKSLHSRLDTKQPFRCPIVGCNKAYTKQIYLESHQTQCH